MEAKHKKRKNVNTKLVIEELHKAFALFNRDLFEGKLPEPAILIQSRGNKKLTLGWCTVNKVWKNESTQEEKYEINLVAEAINRGIFPVMTTFLHELVHLSNLEQKIQDTSRGNTYHNKAFKAEAEKRGLIIEHADKIGWSVTSLTPYLMELIKSYNLNEEAFTFGRLDTYGDKEKKKKKSSSRKYICPECGCTIRATKEVNVICGDCHVAFELANPEDFEPASVEFICLDCGQVFEQPEGTTECPECGGELITMEDYQNQNEGGNEEEDPIEESPEDIIEIPVDTLIVTPEGLTEEPTQLDDGAGNMVDVNQVKIDIPEEEVRSIEEPSKTSNTGWDEERVIKVFNETMDKLNALEGTELSIGDAPIIIKKQKDYGRVTMSYAKTRGRGADKLYIVKISFSKEHLEIHSDFDIVDTIKHEAVHAYVDLLKNSNQKHNDIWKRYCVRVGCEPKATAKLSPVK